MLPSRRVPFVGVLNFRDLGGYPTSDGRITRWGTLYRSDALEGLTEADLELFRSLRIATVIDLRSASEIERTGRGLLAAEPVRFIATTASPDNGPTEWSPEIGDDYLTQRYLRYVEDGGTQFVRAINEMVEADNYPMVFNCFLGKDRSGVLAALVLDCLGVRRQSIVDDYVLTSTRMPSIVARLKGDPTYRETVELTPSPLLDASAVTMSRFLSELDERFGGARSWVTRAGVPPDDLEILSDLLLISYPDSISSVTTS